jgi:hypothetical protein
MRTLRLAATLAFAALVCAAVGSTPARAGELALFPYTFKCPAGWSAQQPGPAKGLTWCAGSGAGDDAFVGELRLFAFKFCPQPDWVRADGTAYPISRNSGLYGLVTARFGGNNQTTFAVPNVVPDTPAGMTWCLALNGRYPQR